MSSSGSARSVKDGCGPNSSCSRVLTARSKQGHEKGGGGMSASASASARGSAVNSARSNATNESKGVGTEDAAYSSAGPTRLPSAVEGSKDKEKKKTVTSTNSTSARSTDTDTDTGDNFMTSIEFDALQRQQADLPAHNRQTCDVPKFRFREPIILREYDHIDEEESEEGGESKSPLALDLARLRSGNSSSGKNSARKDSSVTSSVTNSATELSRKELAEALGVPFEPTAADQASAAAQDHSYGGSRQGTARSSTGTKFSARGSGSGSGSARGGASASGAGAASGATSARKTAAGSAFPTARSTALSSARAKPSATTSTSAIGSAQAPGSLSPSRKPSMTFDMPVYVQDEENRGEDEDVPMSQLSKSKPVSPRQAAAVSGVDVCYDIVPETMKDSERERAPVMKDRYFGAGARSMFYDRLAFLTKQRTITCVSVEEELDALAFDNENLDGPTSDYPFYDKEADQALDDDNDIESKPVTPLRSARSDKSRHSEAHEDESMSGYASETESEIASRLKAESHAFKNKYGGEFPLPGSEFTLPLSPRSRFISGCLQARKNPRASLILRKKLGKSIKLSHMAIGNEVAALLADCLSDMPYLEELDVNNNALTDAGVASILEAVMPIKTLKTLNISRNKMDDDAADALAAYVQLEDCPCETLIMQVSDVDDFEGERFVRCLMENQSITEIDLSDNLIGCAENMRTVIPDMCTCSEAFAEMLEVEGCILKKLTLAWNTIRLGSCVRLTQSLRNNSSLTYLDLSYNSLSYDGGEALGDALLENSTLQYLDVSSNSINASATFTISTGIIENKALTRVILSNNPIGEAGASALMQVPMTVGARCNLSAERCNCGLIDAKCWFSHSNPLGKHELDLSKPYERAVAFALLELIANHATYIFVSAEYESENKQRTNLNLFQTVVLDEKEKFFDKRQKGIVAGLRKMRDASGDREKGIQLFHETDEDGGGSLDHEELTDLLTSVGMDVTPDMVEDIMDMYDIDGEGAIGMPEFLAFLKSQYKEATTRLEEMTEERIMASPNKPNTKYVPPRTGKLHFYVMDGFTRKAKYSVMSSCDQEYAKTVSSDVAAMLGFAVANSKVRLGEAMQMFSTMYGEGGSKATILAELVVKLAEPSDCKKLVMKVTKGDKTQLSLLKNAMGGAYKPYLGILNGYYTLDLSKQMDQIALTRLLEQSQTDNTRRQASSPLNIGQMGDTSQCGNWSSFRNEFMNGKRFAVQPDRFRPMPKSGKLYFDYSMTQKPPINEDLIILSDKRLVKILCNQFLVKQEEVPDYLNKLNMWRRHLKIAARGKGQMRQEYEYDREKGLRIGQECDRFYNTLEDRTKLFSTGFQRENVTVDYTGKKKKEALRAAKAEKKKAQLAAKAAEKAAQDGKEGEEGNDPAPTPPAEPTPESASEPAAAADATNGEKEATAAAAEGALENEGASRSALGSNVESDDEDDENEGHKQVHAEGSKAHIKQKMNEEMAKYRMLIESPLVSKEAKSSRINESLEDIFSNCWLLCRHVAAVVVATPDGSSGRTDHFGSYHVDLIVSLFARIVDVHNFEVVMKQLNPEECAQLYCRIGWLNLFNPTKPEGMYCLDFCRYEERLCAKMMIGLALVEPGDNWKEPSFKWSWDVDEVPGWELTTGYTKDETCTTRGIVLVRYYSGEGKGKGGCTCHGVFRKAMYSLVLCSEDVARIDIDEMFPHLVHGSADTDSDDDEESKEDKKRALLEKAEEDAEDDASPAMAGPPGVDRPLWPGERFLVRNTTMWDELFAPINGCVKQKDPLSLVYSLRGPEAGPEVE